MIKAAIDRGRTALEARRDWGFDRSQYLNSSEAARCIRWLWYDKNTPEQAEPQSWGFARRGSHGEEYVVASLRATNEVSVSMCGNDQQSLRDDKRRLSATPDGVIRFADGPDMGLEIKTIDPRTNVSRLPKAEHVVQFQIAMALINEQTSYTLSSGLLVYMDASNYDNVYEFTIPADASILDRYAKKASKLFSAGSAERLDREGRRSNGCTYCPFKKVCGVPESRGYSAPAAGVGDVAFRLVAVQDDIERLSREKDDLKETLRGQLAGPGKVIIGDVEVTLSLVKGRASLDRQAVAAAGIDLSPFEKVGSPSERLTVNRLK